ncbi:MAG: type II secretion system minor pseudopilin GspK [Rhodoferax sp.]|jgi:general secretion pathway protein K|nr:type II secretion system minor pseudopilin GspK [Rhodoferax sp.]MBP9058946.1 type II secretion system minor pseudopilin GspK [Rhodoferax sp.]MBP9683546.1 type II secretion system minor pseudopilin GspK [Rhodoferax sp.]
MKRATLQRQGGAAILTAMLTVVLVAALASSVMWQQWRGVEVEAAQRSRSQANWVLAGALDWARLILREDARKGGADHLAEPWAVPLAQARLSTFLAVDRSDALNADDSQEAFLSGEIIDLQSRLNVFNLLQEGKIHPPTRLAFLRLFVHLGLSPNELRVMTDNLQLAQGSIDPTKSDPGAPLWPTSVDELAWVGLSPRAIEVLRPYVTVLPVLTSVNLNTASAEVIYACVDGFELADAHRLVRERSNTHFASLADLEKMAGQTGAKFTDAQHGVASHYFEVRGLLRVEQSAVQDESVVQREGLDVKTLSRQHSMTQSLTPLQ